MWCSDTMVQALGFRIKAILAVAIATAPNEGAALFGGRLKAPFVDVVLAWAQITGTRAFFIAVLLARRAGGSVCCGIGAVLSDGTQVVAVVDVVVVGVYGGAAAAAIGVGQAVDIRTARIDTSYGICICGRYGGHD